MRFFVVFLVLVFVGIIFGYFYITHEDDKSYDFQAHCKRKYLVAKCTQYRLQSGGKVDFAYKYNLGNGDVGAGIVKHRTNLPCDTCTYFFISFCPTDSVGSWSIEDDMPFDTSYQYGRLYDTSPLQNTNL